MIGYDSGSPSDYSPPYIRELLCERNQAYSSRLPESVAASISIAASIAGSLGVEEMDLAMGKPLRDGAGDSVLNCRRTNS